MPATVYLVTGGCRSGKSRYAESICTQLCPNPIYVATAGHQWSKSGDEDFTQRMQKHQHDRGSQWTTIEEPLSPSRYADQFSGKAVLVDCLTLWLTNYMLDEGALGGGGGGSNNDDNKGQVDDPITQTQACDRAFAKLKMEFEALIHPYDVTFVFVTNEVGSGTHPATHIARKFVDYQGWFNQFVATQAQQVIHMVCGQPHVVKNELEQNYTAFPPLPADNAIQAQRLDRHLSTRQVPMDPKGYFLIQTDPIQCLIVASFHSCMVNKQGEVCDLEGIKIPCCGGGKSPEPMKIWSCRTAKELTTEIFERWEFLQKAELTVGHAAYIGREAQKAEQCLYQSGRKYQQD